MKKVNTNTFESDVLKSDKPVLMEFGAEWCQPCKVLKPVLEAYSQERSDIDFCFADIDECSELASTYNIMSVPTLMVFKAGELAGRIVGNAPRPVLEKFINESIA